VQERIVILTSYMRPEMTKRSIERISNWKKLKKLVVVIDGLRQGATNQEDSWRKQTISTVESFSSISNIEMWVYSNNVGITEHTLRLQKRSLELDQFPILLEEDIDLDLDSFNSFEHKAGFSSSIPTLRSGYSHFNHPDVHNLNFKGNLFLPIWGLSYNSEFVELVEKTWMDKKYDSSIVKNTLAKVLFTSRRTSLSFRRSVERYWAKYMSWAFLNGNRWDALANYSLWTQDLFSSSAINRIANDVGFMDVRGMNQRVEPSPAPNHTLDAVTVQETTFCFGCEIIGSRILPTLGARLLNSINYRLSKQK